MQWRWRCTFRDAYYVCLLIWPWSHTKLPKIQQHHGPLDDNVINLEEVQPFYGKDCYIIKNKTNVVDLNKYRRKNVR